MAEILVVDRDHPDSARIDRAAHCLRRGGLVAFPTETVYGLGANALDAAAVRRVFQAKGRPSTDPLIVHVTDIDAARALVTSIPDVALRLAEVFWPGPLTLVLPRSAGVPDEVTAGLDTVGIRVPAHPVARALVAMAAVPIAAPSANLFSRPSPTRAEHVDADLGPSIDLILDAGPTDVGLESTVLNISTSPPVLLRPGGVSAEQLRALLPDLVVPAHAAASIERAMPAPGLLLRHYAPRTPLTLFEGGMEAVVSRILAAIHTATRPERLVILGSSEARDTFAKASRSDTVAASPRWVSLGTEEDVPSIASRLYVALRECDALQGDRVLAVQISRPDGLGLALRDRLRRASAGDIVICSN